MRESIYRTPRTYGAPTGYDVELSHYPNATARLAEQILLKMHEGRSFAASGKTPQDIADWAITVAEQFYKTLDECGFMLEIKDPPEPKGARGTP